MDERTERIERIERVDGLDRVVGVVERAEAIRRGWLHRIATVVVRDPAGRILVHRRPAEASRFPGQLNWLAGGATEVGETYEDAAARELAEELGVTGARPHPVLKFLCTGVISPYWLAVHEATVAEPIHPDPAELAWWAWVDEAELDTLAAGPDFVPDGREAWARYREGTATR
ncbi:NUDIX domain-containing protein [Streptomyces sp. NPDC032472]|uniref:NUDIX hydrolase n=1 Tax=Streptomyces sp. NPDC032472 TaxID=3155018 RepID=UPI0033CE573F